MLIVDGQVHIWAASAAERPRTAGHDRPASFTKDDLLREMDAAGVHRAVIVPSSLDGNSNDLALEAARLHPDRLAVMGRLDIDKPSELNQLATWRQQRGMLGLRLTFRNQGNTSDDKLWAAAEKGGVPIMMGIAAGDLGPVIEAAMRHPGLRLVVDHLGVFEGKKDNAAFADLDKLLAAAKRANIAVKASALPVYSSESYPYRGLHTHLRRVYDAFGPKRIFWGSDFTRLKCPYREVVTMFTEEIPWLSSEDKIWIMGRGLSEWVGWPQ